MKTLLTATVLALCLVPPVAEASPKGRGNGNGNRGGQCAWSEEGFCPPGLRNRAPPCVPPGQTRRDEQEEDEREEERDRRDDLQPIDLQDFVPLVLPDLELQRAEAAAIERVAAEQGGRGKGQRNTGPEMALPV